MKKLAIILLSVLVAGLFVACNQEVTIDAQTYANMELGTFVLNGQNYATLQEAVNAKLGKSAKALGENDGVIYLTRNASGPGAVINSAVTGGVTIDFAGYTYSFTNVTGLQGGEAPKPESFGLAVTNGAQVTLKGMEKIDLNDKSTSALTMVYIEGAETKLSIESAPKMVVEPEQYVFWAANGATLTIGSEDVSSTASITGKIAATGGTTEASKPSITIQGNTTVEGAVEASKSNVSVQGSSSINGSVDSASSVVEFNSTEKQTVSIKADSESKMSLMGKEIELTGYEVDSSATINKGTETTVDTDELTPAEKNEYDHKEKHSYVAKIEGKTTYFETLASALAYENYGKTIVLVSDVNLNDVAWTPIGTATEPYRGIFDGAGHTIKNLSIINSTAQYQGLFGVVNNTEIKNLNLENCDVTGQKKSGILIGCVDDGTLEHENDTNKDAYKGKGTFVLSNCTIDSESSISGTDNVGAFIGVAYVGTKFELSNLSSAANVTATETSVTARAGGIAGSLQNFHFAISNNGGNVYTYTVENCKITGEVSGLWSSGLFGGMNGSMELSRATVDDNLTHSQLVIKDCSVISDENRNADAVYKLHESEFVVLDNFTVGNTKLTELAEKTISKYSTSSFNEIRVLTDTSSKTYFCLMKNDSPGTPVTNPSYSNPIGFSVNNYEAVMNNHYYASNPSHTFCSTITGSFEDVHAFFQDHPNGSPCSPDRRFLYDVNGDPFNTYTSYETKYYRNGNSNIYVLVDNPEEVSIVKDGETKEVRMPLIAFAKAVNAGNTYAGYTVTLLKDVDLNNVEWTPIGNSYRGQPGGAYFAGTFDGNGKTISGLTLSSSNTNVAKNTSNEYVFGLFGVVKGATIKNLTVKSVSIAVASDYIGDNVGAIVGYSEGSLTLENCVVGAKGDGSSIKGATVGGVIGRAYANATGTVVTIKGCKNYASVTASKDADGKSKAAGIIGFVRGTVAASGDSRPYIVLDSNENYGAIVSATGDGSDAKTGIGSGIANYGFYVKNGAQSDYFASFEFKNNKNAGSLTVTGNTGILAAFIGNQCNDGIRDGDSLVATGNTNTAEGSYKLVVAAQNGEERNQNE